MNTLKLALAPILALVALALIGPQVVGTAHGLAGPAPTPPAFRPAISARIPTSALVVQPNPFLGYSINVPPGYRRAVNVVESANTGRDLFTARSAQEDAQLCRREQSGGPQAPDRVADFKVDVHAGASPTDFASTPVRHLAFTTVEATTVAGLPAARVVHQPSRDTAYYVIAANARLYEIAPLIFEQPTTQPAGWLDQIVSTFRATPIQSAAGFTQGPRSLCGS